MARVSGGEIMSRRHFAIALPACPAILATLVYPMLLASAVFAAEETARQAPAVRVVVDPRVELLSVLFRLAGNPEYGRGLVPSYVADVEKQFGGFRDHVAVRKARALRGSRGVSFDAVMAMAVHVTDAEKLEEKLPLDPRPEGLDSRWTPEGAREFLTAARLFVRDAKFKEFFDAHRPLYDLATKRMEARLKESAHLEWFDAFFGARPKAQFTLALGMLNGGSCYGPHCRLADGTEELYCVLGVWSVDDQGQPQFDRQVIDTVVHEFCHSYTNALVDRHYAEMKEPAEGLFRHVEKRMASQAYGAAQTMIYESLVRVCVIRYVRQHDGVAAGRRAIEREKERGFLWMNELDDVLARYEADRKKYPTLEAFAPEIVAFFRDYAPRYEKELAAQTAKRPKVVSMTPANGAADVDPALTKITVAFDRPMRDNSWSMVGFGPNFPEIVGKPSYDEKRTTWSVEVRLKPEWSYRFGLNSEQFQAFRSDDGEPLEPVPATFKTGKAKPGEKPVEKKLTKLPEKLGTNVMESTPLVYQGREMLFHSRRVDTPKSDLSQMYLFLVDQKSGKELTRFGARHSLGSAFVDGDAIHVFAAEHSDNDWFHDIHHFRSTDLKNWTREPAIRREVGEHLLNSSVCRDEQGYLMAYESDQPVGFCFKFARSKDLSNWEKVPGLVFTGEKNEYSACPVIRFLKPYYYVIYLHKAIPGHNGWVSFLARSKDLATWELSPKNPILEAGEGEGSNNSDVDLIEIGGKTFVYYCTGDQQTWGDLKRGVYPGPMQEFFESYFPAGEKRVEVSAKR
jgi:hypothetical protein